MKGVMTVQRGLLRSMQLLQMSLFICMELYKIVSAGRFPVTGTFTSAQELSSDSWLRSCKHLTVPVSLSTALACQNKPTHWADTTPLSYSDPAYMSN